MVRLGGGVGVAAVAALMAGCATSSGGSPGGVTATLSPTPARPAATAAPRAASVAPRVASAAPSWVPSVCWGPHEPTGVFLRPSDQAPLLTIERGAQYSVIGPADDRGRWPVRLVSPITGPTVYVDGPECHVTIASPGMLSEVPVSFDAGNPMVALGPGSRPGTTRVRTSIVLRDFRDSIPIQDLGSFEGDVATADLGAVLARGRGRLPLIGWAVSVGPVDVSSQPGGPTDLTLPLLAGSRVVVVRREGRHAAIRVGDGPYIYGWTDSTLTPIPEETGMGGLGGGDPTDGSIAQGTAIEVRPGVVMTTVRRLGVLVGETQMDGRVSITVRGWVSLSGLVSASAIRRHDR